jgi:eukaryotic-like serine/threonine-protein kinase
VDCLSERPYDASVPPPPLPEAPADRLLRALKKSGLLSDPRIDQLIAAAPKGVARDPDKLGEYLVGRGAVTHFQVTKLKQGTFQGLVLGPYHILSPLGKGGMGTVYLAHDTRKPEGRRALVALKVLPPKRAREEDRTLARFLREMDMAQRVSHPHVTKTFEAGDIGGVHYIAMEYIRGQSLRRVVGDEGPLSVARAAHLFAEVADGLGHAHDLGLVHRDLKPSNIMVTPNGHAKVLDLGLALAVDEELPADKMIVGGQGYVLGTMDYIAPEQVDDPTGVDARADLYAMGCSLYFALTGQPPFPGGTSQEKMKRHRTEHPDPLTDFNPTVPIDFARIVQKLMEKVPIRRYQTAKAAHDALRPWAASDPETPYDVDPDQTEAEVVLELERTQKDPGAFFESVPVVVFADKARRSGRLPAAVRDDDEDTPRRKAMSGFPSWLILIPAGLAVMCLGAGLMGLLLYFFKA